MRLLTAIPVYNEEAHLEPVLAEVLRYAERRPGRRRRLDRPHARAARGVSRRSRSIRHPTNLGYGAGLRTAFGRTLEAGYDGLVTLDCDGQHEPSRIPGRRRGWTEADIVSGSRYLRVFDPPQRPPEERRRINVEVTRWLNDCLGPEPDRRLLRLQGLSRLGPGAVRHHRDGYAMPLAGLGAGRRSTA